MNNTVLVFIANYLPGYKSGGPIRSVSSIVEICGHKVNFKLVTSDRDFGDPQPYQSIHGGVWNRVGKGEVIYLPKASITFLRVIQLIKSTNPDAIYLNSFFSIRFSLFPFLISSIFLKKPLIIAPRGEFSPGALGIKPVKKRFFIYLFRTLGLEKKITWQATNSHEKEYIHRAFGNNLDVRVVHNLSLPTFFKTPFPKKTETMKMVFLSRITKKKNIIGALKSLMLVSQPVQFDIYGPASRPEDKSYLKQCEQLVTQLPNHITVKFKGELPNEIVCKTLSMYDLFFLPTLGENFGHVILEALAAGLPLLLSDATPWRELSNNEIGWEFNPFDHDSFSAIIDLVATMPVDEHLLMREKSIAFAHVHVSSCEAANETLDLFESIKQ